MTRQAFMTYAVAKHEASHLLIAHLFYGDKAIKTLQFSNHPKIPVSCIANCLMGDWFFKSNYDYIGIPTLMAGIIADEMAGTPAVHSDQDMLAITSRSILYEIECMYDAAKLVVQVLTRANMDNVLNTLAAHIIKRAKTGATSIRGATLHRIISNLLGTDFKYEKPKKSLLTMRAKHLGPAKLGEFREMRLVYYQISKAWREGKASIAA